jgi:hypothetical protein
MHVKSMVNNKCEKDEIEILENSKSIILRYFN